jgi:hypothetical protein
MLTPEAGEDLYQIVQENLIKGYQINLSDSYHVDEMAWMCKALVSSAAPQNILSDNSTKQDLTASSFEQLLLIIQSPIYSNIR